MSKYKNVLEIKDLYDKGANILHHLKSRNGRNFTGFICPNTGKNLEFISDNLLYSPEGFLAYPVINSIPCLLSENAILAFHLNTDYEKFKKENNIEY